MALAQPHKLMQLTSNSFLANTIIPANFTCKGAGISPHLHIENIPPGTVSLALIMHDPDAPLGDFTHWIIWDMPTDIHDIVENSVPDGAIQGLNDFNNIGYGSPCPPSGTHRYMFELYALSIAITLPEGSLRAQLESSLKDQV